MQPNDLAQWLKFYDDQHLAPPYAQKPFGYGAFGGDGGYDDPGRLAWAQNMAQQGQQNQPPNFFANLPTNQLAPYVQPRQLTEQMPQRQPMNDPMRGRTMNYLASLMGRR